MFGEGFFDGVKKGAAFEGFFEQIDGAVFHGLDGHGDVGVGGEDDNGQFGAYFSDEPEEVEAVEFGHFDVTNEDVAGVVFQGVEGSEGAGKGLALVGGSLEGNSDGFADIGFIIDKKDHILLLIRHTNPFDACRKKHIPPSRGGVPVQRPDYDLFGNRSRMTIWLAGGFCKGDLVESGTFSFRLRFVAAG